MYCKFCGQSIADESIFCAKCGKRQNDDNTGSNTASSTTGYYHPELSGDVSGSGNSGKGKFIAQSGFNSSRSIGLITGYSLSVIAYIGIIVWCNSLKYYDSFYKDKSFIIILSVILLILTVILIAYQGITLATNNGAVCSVYENLVTGKALTPPPSSTKIDFSLTYNQISSIQTEGKMIKIISEGLTYLVPASNKLDADRTVSFIKERLTSSKNVSKSAAQSEWHCPCCGAVNKNYVGTCGCGTRKP